MRKVARTDRNHSEIINTFRRLGCSVKSTHQLGNGFTDIVIGCAGFNYLVEIKDWQQPPSKRDLTDDEKEFHEGWCGRVDICETVDDAVDLVKEWKSIALRIKGVANV